MEFQGEMVRSKDILRSLLHSWRAMIWVCPLRKLWRQWVCSGWCRSRRLETRGHSREPHWLLCWGPGNAPLPTTGKPQFCLRPQQTELPAAPLGPQGQTWPSARPHVTSLARGLFGDATCKSFKVKLHVCARSALRFFYLQMGFQNL